CEEPDARRVRAHLRAELQAPRHRLRPGHHRVPGAPLLSAARARDARLPSSRHRRAGGGYLPVPGQAARHHARAARPGLQELLPRRAEGSPRQRRAASDVRDEGRPASCRGTARREAGGQGRVMAVLRPALPVTSEFADDDARRAAARERFADFGARASICALFVFFATQIGGGYAPTGHVTGLLLLVTALLGVRLSD